MHHWKAFLAALLLLICAAPLAAQDETASVFVYDAWLVTDDGRNGTVYLTIENALDLPITLTGATTPAGDVMLSPMDAAMPTIEPGDSFTMTPDSIAFYVAGAAETPALDDGLAVTLMFEDADGNAYAVTTGALPADAAPEQGAIVVLAGWARPTALDKTDASDPADVISGAYLTLENRGDEADALISISSPRIATVELHETQMDGGIMRMRPLAALPLEPGERHTLAPGDQHLMLIGLESHLLPGQVVALTLTFESGVTLTVAVPVRDEREATQPAAEATESHMGHH